MFMMNYIKMIVRYQKLMSNNKNISLQYSWFDHLPADIYPLIRQYLPCCALAICARLSRKYWQIFQPFINTQLIYVLERILIIYFKKYQYKNVNDFIYAFHNQSLSTNESVLYNESGESSFPFDFQSLVRYCKNMVHVKYNIKWNEHTKIRYIIDLYLYLLGKPATKINNILTYYNDELQMIYQFSL